MQSRRECCGLLVGDRRPAFKRKPNRIATSSETSLQGQGYGSILIAALKDLAVQQEKEAIWIDCPEDLLSYFSQQGFRDEAESDRGVHMVWGTIEG